jgi:hypothetical protein
VRVAKLWSLYHDTGYMTAGRSAAVSCGGVFRLHGFPLMTPNSARIHTAYYDEYARIMGLHATVRFAGSPDTSNGWSEWALISRTLRRGHGVARYPC